MRCGVVLPHRVIGTDAGAARAFATGIEALGYRHLLAYEHVLGAGLAGRPDWTGPYSHADPFHEPLLLFAHLAAVTDRLELATGVLVLPQRPVALVAKQAAELAILSGGRLRLGVGLGWNAVEFEALGASFGDRAARFDEQLDVLRRLWTEPLVSNHGRHVTIDDAGINPLPPSPPPVWIGCGAAEPALARVVRAADGWIPHGRSVAAVAPVLDRLRTAWATAGREPTDLGVDGRLILGELDRSTWGAEVTGWRALGASHLSVYAVGLGLDTVDAQLAFLERFRDDHGL